MAAVAFDPFEALGLPRDASSAAIKARYHALARRYHPNRTIVRPGDDSSTSTSHEHFQNVHQAWQILSKSENRRRRVELLNLLDLQDEMLAHYEDLLNEVAEEESPERHHGSELEGYISSDADEDLPNVGLQRRQTVLTRESRGARRFGERRDSLDAGASMTSPTKKSSKWNLIKSSHKAAAKQEAHKDADYFTLRRKKLEKLRRKELEAFMGYRNAMVQKFEAEEEAEKHQEKYEWAKWKREYFERAPRGTTERMRSFQHFMGAVNAFEQQTPRQRNRSTVSYSTMSPVVGQGEGPQFLIPDHALSRKTTMHRRGWSSDISGDQTESSEDESDAHGSRRRSPPAHWHEYSRRNKTAHHAPFPRPQNGTPTGPQQRANPSDGPFKLIVRQPTDLGSIAEAQDSSGDTASGSSRSPSPHANGMNGVEHGRFTIVGSNTADLFGVPQDRRARSPSPHGRRRSPSLSRTSTDSSGTAVEGCQFTTKQLGIPQHQHVPFAHVHLLSREEKSRLLGSDPDTDTDPDALLAQLHALNPNVASRFEVKPNMEQLFNFRLIYGNREVISRQHQSFIALSYRRKLQVDKNRHHHHFTLPLEPEIFQAVWDERQSDTEGVWIDQICIDQESDVERTISMSAMDLVYRSARLIVVALDDIELNAQEGILLQKHMDEYNAMSHVPPRQRFRHKQPPYLESHDDLYKIVRRMLSSSWFRRAWCRHEMRLAKHHIFLIPCRSSNTRSGRDVLRFNSKCIAHLLDLSTEVPFEPEVESVKPALHAFFRDRSKMTPDERQMSSHHGNFSTVVAEVFAMEAGGDPRVPAEQRLSDARKDKISIILNTMECGLALQSRFRMEGLYNRDSECFHDLSLLALAARDPGVLCSVGAPLVIDEGVTSWMFVPTVADAGLNNTKTLPRLPGNFKCVTKTSGLEHFIQLDLKFLRHGNAWRPTLDQELLDLAQHFTSVCEKRKWGRNRKRYLTHDRKANLLFGPMKEVYVETLALILYCGPDWMGDVCQRYSMSRWKVDLQGACELLIALNNTNGRWPDTAWSERAAGFIMDFVNFLVIRGLPQRQISKPEPWRPCCVTMPTGGRVLTFTPVSDSSVRPAIPSVLINPDYVHLARLWVLKPRTINHNHTTNPISEDISDWTLLGKSVLFSDELSIGQMYAYGGDFKEQQRIFGRHRDDVPTNGLIRVRSSQR